MALTGYADPLSACAGERVRFCVSCDGDGYDATVVRLLHGDEHPDGPGFKEREVEAEVNGARPGRRQGLRPGSYLYVPDAPPLGGRSFTVATWIFPTTAGTGREQGLIGQLSADRARGWALLRHDEGDLALLLDGELFRTGVPLLASFWYLVAAIVDGERDEVTLVQLPRDAREHHPATARVTKRRRRREAAMAVSAPILMAALPAPAESASGVAAHFDGKLDAPAVIGRAVGERELETLWQGPVATRRDAAVAAWDFSRDMATSHVVDTARHGLHGELVNLPARAVTGVNWTGSALDFTRTPQEYGAIHFHADDLEDAGWHADLELTIPPEWRTGFYALRLRGDDGAGGALEDHVPFFVSAQVGRPAARVALLVPTMTYQAYGNERAYRKLYESGEVECGAIEELVVHPNDRELDAHPEVGLSCYDAHADGSPSRFSSWRRPLLSLRPSYPCYTTGCARHLSADLYIEDWLDAKRLDRDVLTDHDLHRHGSRLLEPYGVVMTGTHPEYWTGAMLDALDAHLAGGGRLMYLGGNGFCWPVGTDPARPHVIEVRRGVQTSDPFASSAGSGEGHLSLTGEPSGLWRFRGRPERRRCGVAVTAEGWPQRNAGYVRTPQSHDPRAAFIFDGVRDDGPLGEYGLSNGGAAGDEIDRADHDDGTPPHALLVATSAGRHSRYLRTTGDPEIDRPGITGEDNPNVRSDVVFYEGPRGGMVFSTGSIAWCGSLSHDNYDNDISRITENVLRRFADAS